MGWSYSGSKQFKRCPRQWYFKNSVVNNQPNAKDKLRREAFYLSQLQSLEAWRGSVVDTVIEKKIVLPMLHGGSISEDRVMRYAEEIFAKQLDFAYKLRSREPGMTKTKGDDQYAALFAIEYGYSVTDEEVEQAWQDVETALINLFAHDDLLNELQRADQLVAQRVLYLHDYDFTVQAKPDVIALYHDEPPFIIDWKVYTKGYRDSWLQLACYALALARGKPHKDFITAPNKYAATDMRLAEVQLLTDQIRWYDLADEDVDAIERYIVSTGTEMLVALGNASNDVLRPFDFDAAHNPNICAYCPFQKMCWENSIWQA